MSKAVQMGLEFLQQTARVEETPAEISKPDQSGLETAGDLSCTDGPVHETRLLDLDDAGRARAYAELGFLRYMSQFRREMTAKVRGSESR